MTPKVYIYTVATNSWSHHSNLPWTDQERNYDSAIGIVSQSSGQRLLMVNKGRTDGALLAWNLDTSSGWHQVATLHDNHWQAFMRMVSLKPFTAALLGGYSKRHGFSLRNIWQFNPTNNNFEESGRLLQTEHYGGMWAVAGQGYRATQAGCRNNHHF